VKIPENAENAEQFIESNVVVCGHVPHLEALGQRQLPLSPDLHEAALEVMQPFERMAGEPRRLLGRLLMRDMRPPSSMAVVVVPLVLVDQRGGGGGERQRRARVAVRVLRGVVVAVAAELVGSTGADAPAVVPVQVAGGVAAERRGGAGAAQPVVGRGRRVGVQVRVGQVCGARGRENGGKGVRRGVGGEKGGEGGERMRGK
jgi:hypothetical protein